MFQTIGNTWQITKLSWKVLQLDRELIFFPIMGTIGAIIVGAIAAGVFAGTGTFDRLGGGEAEFNVVDLIISLVAYFGALYMVIFCNAALIAAARERLEGGDPNVMSGIRAVRGMWLAILGWTIITGTVGLILQALQSAVRDNSQGVLLIVAIPVVILAFIAPVAGIIVGVILGGLALASVAAMEGIFKAALYEWVSEGKGSEWFDRQLLSNAYMPRS